MPRATKTNAGSVSPLFSPALLLLPLLALGCGGDEAPRRWEFATMGTVAALEIHDEDREADRPSLTAFEGVCADVNRTMSTWDPLSEISRANRAPAGSTLVFSKRLGDCLAAAIDVRERSGGAFSPGAESLMRLWGFYRREGRLPAAAEISAARATLGAYGYDAESRGFTKRAAGAKIDLGGIAKGYAVDLAAAELRALGVQRALVDLGGNLYCLGSARGGDGWRVGIRDPLDKSRYFAMVNLRDLAVATSGSYERFVTIDGRRYGHIMNPATGHPAEGLLSATAICKSATLADGLSTTLFVLGPDDAELLLAEEYPEAAAVLVLPARGAAPALVRASRGLVGRLEILPAYREHYMLEFF